MFGVTVKFVVPVVKEQNTLVPPGQAPEYTSLTRSVAVPNARVMLRVVFNPELNEYHTSGQVPLKSHVGVGPSCVANAVVPVVAPPGHPPKGSTAMGDALAQALFAGGAPGVVMQMSKLPVPPAHPYTRT